MAWEWLNPVTTAVVAVTGVAGTVWAATVGRRAQTEVAKAQSDATLRLALLEEKRLLYAEFLGLADLARTKISSERNREKALVQLVGRDEPDEDEIQLEGGATDVELPLDVAELLAEMSSLRMQIMILGGAQMGHKASDLFSAVREYARRRTQEGDVIVVAVSVGQAMHLDATLP
ncbi:hypothetical protein [Micromonospora sp. URMC 103]|uniref:hypothetical protein n=1 Tax=Micromonospora sp. URMC 103 TaxID=3423406 RepID=UPI003F19E7AF